MIDYAVLANSIKEWGKALGFHDVRIADAQADMSKVESELSEWLSKEYHGDMDYMAKHGTKRTRPAELEPGTQRVISVCMNYAPPDVKDSWEVIHDGQKAFISRYALGRDYHKVLRARLQKLADKITEQVGTFHYRVFSDSAPVMEVAWAQQWGWGGVVNIRYYCRVRLARCFFWRKFILIYPCLLMSQPSIAIVAVALGVSMFAQHKPLLHPIRSMHGAVFHISR